MFYAIRAIPSETLRTQEVSLRKDAGRHYGGREARTLEAAAVLSFGRSARQLGWNGAANANNPALGASSGAASQAQPPPSAVFKTTAPAAAETEARGNVFSGHSTDTIPYDVLQRAAAAQDEDFEIVNAFTRQSGPPLPLIGGAAEAAEDGSPRSAVFERSESARKPFGREIPFDLANPNATEEQASAATDEEATPAPASLDSVERTKAEALSQQTRAEHASREYAAVRISTVPERVTELLA
jgi:hypothetical protein